ncbi:Uu.00g114250.m01.CDS01 [Anthostomella pinea]|uniref:Uu.00g114250.m01.CDS01 n=1 Tax=Anthostomella pinea TaxID=933095 RepID=A0AAI8VGB5_9PEZI|nr:Uu.00g114250.m01.CDS01 [Anthostomella pinea]
MSPSKQEHDEEEQAFLSPGPAPNDAVWSRKSTTSRKATRYLRLALEIAMAIVIGLFVANTVREKSQVKPSPVPKLPRKTYTFLPDPQYVSEDMLFDEQDTLHTLHSWIPLSADARGYVQIPDHDSYDILNEPYTVPINRTTDGPAYMMAVFHQLHCLSYIVNHYQQGYAGTELTEEVAHHSSHCFDYLRQSIMCAGDTNLEGETEAGPGWGSEHECVNYDALLNWANERSAMKWRNALLPGEAIL